MAPACPASLDPQRIGLGRHAGQGDIQIGQIDRAGDLIVHEGRAEHLAGVRIINGAFRQRLPDALRQIPPAPVQGSAAD